MVFGGLSFRRSGTTPRAPEINASAALHAVYGNDVDQQDTPPSLLMFIL
jgi:hypothetical protein